MVALLLPILLVSSPDLSKAQRHYDRARYEKALELLGASCDDAGDFLACERLRALIHIALGEPDQARSAFGRMLTRDPDASLGPDVSPKVQSFFTSAKREVLELTNLEIEPVDLADDEAPWVLKVFQPNVDNLEAVTAHVIPPGREVFEKIELAKEGDVFVGSLDAEVPEDGTARYYLVSRVSTGAEIAAGSETEPLELAVRVIGGGSGDGGGEGDGGSPFDLPGMEDDDEDGLPTWALWTIVGGGVAAVALTVTLAVVLSGSAEPGSVDVNIRFVDL